MIYVALKDIGHRRLPFYLATEEWIARNMPPDDYFFSWRVSPTVICGRHQNMAAEVDMDYCRQNGIDVVRRKSGGGCVYADTNNFMFSYICPSDEVTRTFGRYTNMISGMLRNLGLEAEATGRNDILINGFKVAGNAFYHLPGRSIVHGTMLYDFDPSVMSRTLTPSRAKLVSKGIKSVPSRVSCLMKEGLTISKEEFERYAIESLTEKEYIVTPEDISQIEEIEKTYYDPSFLSGAHTSDPDKKATRHICGRIEGVGEFDIEIRTDNRNCIQSIDIGGDFFILSDPDEIGLRLRGAPCNKEDIRAALEELDLGKIISGLNLESLLSLIIE